MKMSKVGYFSEFLVFPPLIIIAMAFVVRDPVSHRPAVWVMTYLSGLVGWTLIEYLLHRVLFHQAPVLSQLHERHHRSPQDLIGTPAWVSTLVGVLFVAGPSWTALGFGLGTTVTGGFVTGYLWYVLVHYATHHWQPPRGSYLYRARLRHAGHHHGCQEGNFGVTTNFWDYVFATVIRPLTLNQRVQGSSPCAPTTLILKENLAQPESTN